MTEYADIIEPVARLLLGEPNRAASSKKTELRYGKRGSLSVDLTKGTWFDNETGTGGGVLDLITRETGLTEKARSDWMHEHGFDDEADRPRRKTNGSGQHFNIVKTYDYVDETGKLLSQVCRLEPKDFRQRRPDNNARDGWSWSVRGVRNVPYHLPELIEAIANGQTVFVVEGEKDADNLWRIGVPATTNAGGAGKWRDELTEFFSAADVVIIEDFDPQKLHPKTKEPMFHPDGRPILPGQDHAQAVAAALDGVAERVRVLKLKRHWPDMPPKGDISDWLAVQGHTREQLDALVEQVPTWSPGQDSETPPRSQRQATLYIPPDPASIPRRQWLHGMHYMRGVVTATVAPGGFGKTTLSLFEAVVMAVAGYRVWYISAEDDRNEIDRRIAAHCQHHNVSPMDLAQHLYVDDKTCFPLKIAKMGRNGVAFDDDALVEFESAIERAQIDVVILDPFISFHYLPENDTAAMDALVKRLGDIAMRRQCCIELSHHVRKPSMGQVEITVYDARGAGAIVNAVRSCRVLNQMPRTAAEIARINPEDRFAYIRIDPGKRNMAPPENARWGKLINVEIGNGDHVQALDKWSYPIDVTTDDDKTWLRVVLADKALRASSQANDWLGHKVGERFNLNSTENKNDIITINRKISRWEKEGLIQGVQLPDEKRRPKKFWTLGDSNKAQTQEAAAREADDLLLPLYDE